MDTPRRPLRSGLIASPPTARALCPQCRRPVTVCYCAALTKLDTVTRVVILQHPRESGMPIGTAHMAKLCLPNATLHVGIRWDVSPALDEALGDPSRPPILLYPGRDARDILREPPEGPVTLIVVDGTWSQAKTIVRDNPRLAALPRYAFETPEPTHYRIRREPRAEYVSTIEALMHVLGALERDPEKFRALLGPMHAMIDAHIAHQPESSVARFRHPRETGPRVPPIPSAILERPDDLVCVVGEANAWPSNPDGTTPRDELIHWVARRVTTGETFDVVARPPGALAPRTSFHSELAADRIVGGVPCEELVAAFARWTRPTDVICAWGHYGPRLFVSSGGSLPFERIDMRLVARHFHNAKVGTLDAYAARLATEAPAAFASDVPPPDGRAGRRIGMLTGIVRAWRGMA